MSPVVSVVLTTHKTAAPLLQAAIASIRSQTVQDLELIVVVDSETDGPATAVLSRAAVDERVQILRPGRVGRGRALNIGLREAAADLLAIQDADDESHPERLERQCQIMTAHDRYWVLGAQAHFTYDIHAHADWPLAGVDREVTDIDASLLIRNSIVHTSALLRRDQVLGIGGYSETRASQFDLDLFLRVRDAGGALGVANAPLVLSRVHLDQEFEFGQAAKRRIVDNYRLQSSHLAREPLSRRLAYRALMLARIPARLVNHQRRRRTSRRWHAGHHPSGKKT